MSASKLTEAQLLQALRELPNWDLADGKLHRRFKFPDFGAAFGFMTTVALASEAANHHPEWFNVYNRVEVWLTTHEAEGISEKDLALARLIDALPATAASR
jgi:4a-hydroxytetrahydrobiopterin dehydratase